MTTPIVSARSAPLVTALAACLIAGCAVQTGALPATRPQLAAPSPVAANTAQPPLVAVGPTGDPPDPNTVPVPPAGSCRLTSDGLPDHACTPGLLNPNVSVAQLCAAGFSTRTIRPPVSYTDVLKRRIMQSYGIGDRPAADYELDHLVSLEDEGHPWAPANLWPQERAKSLPGGRPTGIGFDVSAESKDQVETGTHKRICAAGNPGMVAALQAQLAYDWRVLRSAGVVGAVGLDEPTAEPEP